MVNFFLDIGLECLVEDVGVSVWIFLCLFQCSLGMGFVDWWWQVQLVIVVVVLIDGCLVVGIVYVLGYMLSVFSDMFCCELGVFFIEYRVEYYQLFQF